MIRRPATTSKWIPIALHLLLVASALPRLSAAEQVAKRPLTHADYDGWRSIQAQQLSSNGKYVAYALVPEEGDGEIVVRNIATGGEWRHARGSRPEPVQQQQEATGVLEPRQPRGTGGGQAAAAGQLTFMPDSTALVFTIYPAKAEVDKAKK
ncbi:MAG TPA: hypothetical protein VFV34_18050, partial [Blastocatellia bacterium]|nr:hypothetical protein [Blastocatellia bacterium]